MGKRTKVTSSVMAGCLIALLAGCVSTQSMRERSSSAPEQVRRAADDEVAEAQLAEMAVEASDTSALERLLADRRRGDYPEIEAEPFGFTITEQVRIASDSYEKYDQALILLRQERFEEAIAALVELTELAPQITAPYVDLGIAYGRVGDLERAASVLETAAQLSPDHPLVHNELGIIYRRSGRFAEARAEYEKALSVFPDFHFARRNLAVLCDLYLADIQCALQNYQLYLASVDEDPEVEIWIADLSARAGENLQGALR